MLPADFSVKISPGKGWEPQMLELTLNGKRYVTPVDSDLSPSGGVEDDFINSFLRDIWKAARDFRQRSTYNRTFVVPQDFEWLATQGEAVRQLWLESHQSLGLSIQWHPLSTTLKRTAFKESRRVLTEAGIFSFKPKPLPEDARKHEGWLVRHQCCERLERLLQELKEIEVARASPN